VNEAALGEEFFGSGTCKKMTKKADKSETKSSRMWHLVWLGIFVILNLKRQLWKCLQMKRDLRSAVRVRASV
jgi:hypothetical protein